jgi:hypothetical protein
MSSGFEAHRRSLEQQASQVDGHAAEHEAAVQRLRECGTESWGPDPIFSVLHKLWSDCCQSMVDARQGATGVMRGTGDGIVLASRHIESGEHASRMPEII